ncbi:MAG: hypothetical protein KAR17_07025 [Cyclobacteriaceae bacterium]|nr:hypothetical protein [Cyclobacteriaceae bacterium]
MKRRKKKVNSQQSKQDKEARLNLYKKRVLYFMKLLGCEEAQALISKSYLRGMYYKRKNNLPIIRQSTRVIADHQSIRKIQSDLDVFISDKKIEIYPDGPKVSPREVMVYIKIIYLLVTANEKSTDAGVLKIVNQFKEKAPDLNSLYGQANMEIGRVMCYIGLSLTHLNERICWLEYASKNQGKNILENNIEIVEKIPDQLMIVIDNHPRPVYRLAMAFPGSGFHEVSVSSDQLFLDKSMLNVPIPVYFQNHVLHRLEERLDCLSRTMREYYLYSNLRDPKISQFKGRTLVEYKIENQSKMGYLVVEYLDGILLVKTFLLLSNRGTPEGQQLEEVSGMNKIDREYWTIDRLSTFQNSDMKDHPKVKEVFEKSGCGTLFHKLPILDHGEEMQPMQAIQMLKYLKMDEVNEPNLI